MIMIVMATIIVTTITRVTVIEVRVITIIIITVIIITDNDEKPHHLRALKSHNQCLSPVSHWPSCPRHRSLLHEGASPS